MKLQRQLSNGNYVDVKEEREEHFLSLALEQDQRRPDGNRFKLGLSSIDDAIAHLKSGQELRYDTDWYAKIRDGAVHEKKVTAARAKRDRSQNYSNDGWTLDCGCTVYYRSHIMNANMGTSCTDCYDKMS